MDVRPANKGHNNWRGPFAIKSLDAHFVYSYRYTNLLVSNIQDETLSKHESHKNSLQRQREHRHCQPKAEL